jgi:hypothetical protein
MYLRRIEIENNGPINYLDFKFPFDAQENPQPVLFVGQNGAGKSILISHIVNAIIDAKSSVYKDTEIEEGMVYKLRSPIYVTHGQDFYRSYVHFDDDFVQGEIQAVFSRQNFEDTKGYTPADRNWSEMPTDQASLFKSNFRDREAELRNKLSKFTLLYFPANRFEEPAWLNIDNLKNAANYGSSKRLQGVSGRKIINYSPLRENQDWLLDVIYDSFAIERKVQMVEAGGVRVPILVEASGPATQLRASIEQFILQLLRVEGPLTWGVGSRGRRNISLSANTKQLSSNLFSLSTGQTALLNIFLTLIRDYDISDAAFSGLSEIRGIVVIDEIDLHLHTELQHTILPALIALFPKVQFVLTTHSPLFILGLEKKLGNNGFALLELPHGNPISVERFSEFESAYQHFRESARFEEDIRSSIVDSQTPILFAEGSIDIDYISTAAELLNRQESVRNFRLLDANGFGGLDKIWKHFDSNIAQLTNRRVTLLYDCDISKPLASKPGVSRLVLPQQAHKISKGIENLFLDDLIDRAREMNPAFIDVTPGYQKTVRGAVKEEPERWEINPDEKRNLANWVIANGTAADFAPFSIIFDLIDTSFREINAA